MSNLKFRLFFIFLAVGFIFISHYSDIKKKNKYKNTKDKKNNMIC